MVNFIAAKVNSEIVLSYHLLFKASFKPHNNDVWHWMNVSVCRKSYFHHCSWKSNKVHKFLLDTQTIRALYIVVCHIQRSTKYIVRCVSYNVWTEAHLLVHFALIWGCIFKKIISINYMIQVPHPYIDTVYTLKEHKLKFLYNSNSTVSSSNNNLKSFTYNENGMQNFNVVWTKNWRRKIHVRLFMCSV